MRKYGAPLLVIVAAIAIGWLIGRMSSGPGPELPEAAPAPAKSGDAVPDPSVATLRAEVERLRRDNARLAGALAEAKAVVREEVAAGPVTFAEETGDEATGTLRVLVVDAEGRPLADREVKTWRLQNGANVDNLSATTGSDGTAEFPTLAPGPRYVNLVLPGGMVTLPAEVRGGRVTLARVPFPAGSVLRGVVRDEEKGPLAAVAVGLSRRDGLFRAYLTATTGEDGGYRFENVPAGTWSVSLSGASLGYGRRSSKSVEIPAGGGEVVKDFLTGRLGLSGRVLDADSRVPIAGATVTIQRGGPYRSVTSDGDGVYRFADLAAGSYLLCISRDGYGIEFLRDVEVPDGGRKMDIELTVAATLILTIYDPEGRPYVGSIYFGISPVEKDAGTRVGTSVTADPDGRAVYRRIVPGEYRFRLKAEGIGEGEAEATVGRGETHVTVRLAKP